MTRHRIGPKRLRSLAVLTVTAALATLVVGASPAASADPGPCDAGFPVPDLQSTSTLTSDLVLTGSEELLIENMEFIVEGNVYLSGQAQLVLRNAKLVVDHYPRQEIFVTDHAMVTAENTVFSGFLHTSFAGDSTLMVDRVSLINLIGVNDRAAVTIENSCIFDDRFGLVQVGSEADVRISDSVVGALGLEIPSGSHIEIDGLVSGFFDHWAAHDAVSPSLPFDLTLERTTVMENPGYSGGYELGWNVFTTADADVVIRDSVLNKLVVGFDGEDVEITDLDRNRPVSIAIGDVELIESEIRGQWGIFVSDGDLLVEDSDGVWLWPVGSGDTTIIRTALNEFDPRRYTGTIRLTDSSMTNGFEVFDASAFRMEGSVDMRDIGPLFTSDSSMTRSYRIVVVEEATGLPVAHLGLEVVQDGSVVWSGTTGTDGAAGFELTFGRDNYESKWRLRSVDPAVHLDREVSISSDTPVFVSLTPDPDGSGWLPSAPVNCDLDGTGPHTAGMPYRTIEDGIEAAGNGGVVDVAPGICPEIVELGDGVTVRGSGPDLTVIEGNVFANGITGAKLSNVTVTDDDTAGIHCYDAQLTVTNSVVRDQPHNGIHASACDITVQNDTFVWNGASGINLLSGSEAIIENNVFAHNGEFGVVADTPGVFLRYNGFWENGLLPFIGEFVPGPGNLYAEPHFISDTDLRYTGGSPFIHAGNPDPAFNNPDGTRNTLGAYGGPGSSMDPVADEDEDNVLDTVDWCPGTVLPDRPLEYKPNRYWVTDAGEFVSDAPNAPTYAIAETAGCSANQIVDELELGVGQERFGLSRSALERWIDLVALSTS